LHISLLSWPVLLGVLAGHGRGPTCMKANSFAFLMGKCQ
jgi:hypothetical protein